MGFAQKLIDNIYKPERRQPEPKVLQHTEPIKPRTGHNVVRSIEIPQRKYQTMTTLQNRQMAYRVKQQERQQRIQDYRNQRSYGVPMNKQTVTRTYSALTRRIPIQKRRMPGQPMIRQQSVAIGTRFISGRNLPYAGRNKGYAGRGRPKGSFYKYSIPGVGPVGVFEWRKWQRNQQRLLAMKMMQENQNLSYPEARASLRQVQRQIPQQVYQQPYQPPMQMPTQPEIMQPQAPQAQFQQVPDDGWGLLRIKSPFSMTTVNRPVDPIANAQTPLGNRNTNYYSEPDFISGQQVMKQRPSIGGFGLW